jgi:tetratricopeptide (TPR) repeat protein
VLLGECRFRAARSAAGTASYESALTAFEAGLAFFTEPEASLEPPQARTAPKEDPVLHIRVASIYFMRAQESGFTDAACVAKAIHHYRRSLVVAPTAEAWRNAGVCTYQKARLLPRLEPSRERMLQEAMKYLVEANLLDKCRPQINVSLAICAVELGQVQVAKQTLRQVLRHEDRLDAASALELAGTLIRFSDEHGRDVCQEERVRLVQDKRYADEAIAVAKVALKLQDDGKAHLLLARARMLKGEDSLAVSEFCAALPLLAEEPEAQDEVASVARTCAMRLVGEPDWLRLVEETVASVLERRQGGGAEGGEAADATNFAGYSYDA